MDSSNIPSFSTLMYFRHRVSASESLKIMSDWLEQHPKESEETLVSMFNANEVIFKNNKIVNRTHLTLKEAQSLATKIQQENVLEIKDRWYHLKLYEQCFIGSELVDYLCEIQDIGELEAILIGQDLFKYNLISHVCNDHDFKNDFLFYRFQNQVVMS